LGRLAEIRYSCLIKATLATWPGLGHESIPGIGWIALEKHFLKDNVGVGFPMSLPQGLFIVDPGIDDNFCSRVVAEEEAKAPADLGPAPMAMGLAQGCALTKSGATWIGWDGFQHQPGKRLEKLDVGVALPV